MGKTSLCHLLRDEWDAQLVLEPCDANPFLAAFYADRERYAFPAQMFYLATRYGQQLDLAQGDLFHDLIISDYLWAKDRLFAEQTLEGDELALYDRFARLLSDNIARPEFVVFLDAPTDIILQRINRRAIRAEQVIEPEYLDSLRERYMRLWHNYDAAPVYVLDTSGINYVDDPTGRDWITRLIRGYLDGTPIEGAPKALRQSGPEQISLFT